MVRTAKKSTGGVAALADVDTRPAARRHSDDDDPFGGTDDDDDDDAAAVGAKRSRPKRVAARSKTKPAASKTPRGNLMAVPRLGSFGGEGDDEIAALLASTVAGMKSAQKASHAVDQMQFEKEQFEIPIVLKRGDCWSDRIASFPRHSVATTRRATRLRRWLREQK